MINLKLLMSEYCIDEYKNTAYMTEFILLVIMPCTTFKAIS